MGGPCFNGGPTFQEVLLLGEEISRRGDRYEELISVKRLMPYNSCYEIIERDSAKGRRIMKIDAKSGGIVRDTKC